MIRIFKYFVTILALCVSVQIAYGQTAPKPKAPSETPAEITAEQAEARIDDSMVTMSSLVEALSNNLGQLHYLRTLCYSKDDQKWREVASNMMQIEAPKNDSRRRELVSAFNAGFYAQKERYETCSTNVAVDVAALAENGRHLAVMLGDPYREQ